MNQQLLDFIKKQSLAGRSRDEISHMLITQGGWTETEVNDAFAHAFTASAPVTPPAPQTPPSTPVINPTPTPTSSPRNSTPLNNSHPSVSAPRSWQETAAPGVYGAPQTKPRLRKTTTIGLIILFLIIAAGAAWGFVYYFPSLMRPEPEEVLARVAQSLAETPSIHIDGTVNVEGSFDRVMLPASAVSQSATGTRVTATGTPERTSGTYDVRVGVRGDIDRSGENPRASLSLSPDVSLSIPPLTIDLAAELDTVTLNRTVYVQIRSITDLLLPIDLTRLRGVWVRLDESSASDNGVTLPSGSRTELLKLLSESGAFEVTESLPQTVVGDTKVYRYGFRINLDSVITLFERMVSEYAGTELTAEERSEIERARKLLSEFDDPTGEIWIDTKTHFPRRIALSYTFNGARSDTQTSSTEVTGTASVELELSPLLSSDIVEPANATSLGEALSSLFAPGDVATSTGATGTPVR